jgi:hypothetical protein
MQKPQKNKSPFSLRYTIHTDFLPVEVELFLPSYLGAAVFAAVFALIASKATRDFGGALAFGFIGACFGFLLVEAVAEWWKYWRQP